MRALPAALLALAALLAGCGDTPISASFKTATAQFGRNFHRGKPAPITRAAVRALGKGPYILASLPKFHNEAAMGAIGQNGDVITWSDPSLIEVSTRQGLVTATRGVPGNLMSAQLPALSDIARGSGTVAAIYYFLNGEGGTAPMAFSCTLADLGPEDITVLEIGYRTRHVTQTCNGTDLSFTNDYWFGPKNLLRQSKQWIGPASGLILIGNLAE